MIIRKVVVVKFYVCDRGEIVQVTKDTVYLRRDNWDDFHYKTTFNVSYGLENGQSTSIGQVKIGIVGMEEGMIFNIIPKQFEQLDDHYFSLGQDEVYYANICGLGDDKRRGFLTALKDVAYDLNHFKAVRTEQVMITSLMRSISKFSVQEQFNRIAHGGARLTKYNFTYTLTDTADTESEKSQITFEVNPKSNPPTNVHVLIGRNGTGKTTLIKNLIYSIRHDDATHGTFDYAKSGRLSSHEKFANVLCVAFSPFDDFSAESETESEIPYSYIGLDKRSGDLFQAIENQFCEAFLNCMINTRKRKLWLNAIEILKSDPTFDDLSIDSIAHCEILQNGDSLYSERTNQVRQVFSTLSSGHKVVLLIITCCVDKAEEKSIVFIDEPENHLHPPLLSALIRSLSDLLMDRNGVAIISTHSPVVLQEVPSSCVWALRRAAGKLVAERLECQTFGASIGSLTNEIFGLEVTKSGFHKLLIESINKIGNDYDWVLDDFNDQLGNEARVLLRTILAMRKDED